MPEPPPPSFAAPTLVVHAGTDIAAFCLGGAGPLVLLLHATGFHGRCWLPVAEVLTPHYTVWTIDQRGHGQSGKAPPYDWTTFRDDALAVVDALGGGPMAAVGHSMGGAVAILAEQEQPGTFDRMYCYEPIVMPPGRRTGGPDLATLARKRRDVFPSREAARANYVSKPPFSTFSPDALDAYVTYGFADQPEGTVTLSCRRDDEASVYESSGNHQAFDALDRVSAPVWVARGGPTSNIPAEWQDAVVERLPRGHAAVFEDLSHFGPMEDPQRVGKAVVEAFRGV